MTIDRAILFLFGVLTTLLQFAQCQVNIEVYDAKIFASKIDRKVYNPNHYPNKSKALK